MQAMPNLHFIFALRPSPPAPLPSPLALWPSPFALSPSTFAHHPAPFTLRSSTLDLRPSTIMQAKPTLHFSPPPHGEAPPTWTSHAPSKCSPRLLCILALPPRVEAAPTRSSHVPSKHRPRLLCILAPTSTWGKPLVMLWVGLCWNSTDTNSKWTLTYAILFIIYPIISVHHTSGLWMQITEQKEHIYTRNHTYDI